MSRDGGVHGTPMTGRRFIVETFHAALTQCRVRWPPKTLDESISWIVGTFRALIPPLPAHPALETSMPASRPLSLSAAVAVLALGAAVPAPAQQVDPTVVITRTVHPRIATRALPKDELPIKAEATTFPRTVFLSTMDSALAPLVGDDALGETGSAGVVGDALGRAGLGGAGTGLLGAGPLARGTGGGVPLGAGASIGQATGRATGTIGATISSALSQALGATKTGGGP